MKSDASDKPRVLEDKAFLWLIIVASLAFAWIIAPLYGAVFWAMVISILFTPLYRRLTRGLRGRRNLAALSTLALILLIVVLPLTLVIASLVTEATSVYAKIQSGELN